MTEPLDRAALIAARILAGDDLGLDASELASWRWAATCFQDGDEVDLRHLLARDDAAEAGGRDEDQFWRDSIHAEQRGMAE